MPAVNMTVSLVCEHGRELTHLLRRLAGALSSCRVKIYSCCVQGITIKEHDHKRRYNHKRKYDHIRNCDYKRRHDHKRRHDQKRRYDHKRNCDHKGTSRNGKNSSFVPPGLRSIHHLQDEILRWILYCKQLMCSGFGSRSIYVVEPHIMNVIHTLTSTFIRT